MVGFGVSAYLDLYIPCIICFGLVGIARFGLVLLNQKPIMNYDMFEITYTGLI